MASEDTFSPFNKDKIEKMSGIMKYIIIILSVVLLAVCTAHAGWNRGEVELLNLAYQYGKKILPENPEILQVLMMNETVVGRWGRYGDDHFEDWRKHCFGVMQIQFYTARFCIKNFTSYKMTDKQLVTRLRFDDAFCIELAGYYVKWLFEFNHGNFKKTILSYNVGPGNVQKHGLSHDPNHYLARAIKNLSQCILPFNKRHGNGTIVEYKIRKYDTLYKIAAKLLCDGKRWREILDANPDIEPRNLQIGDVLLVRK